MKTLLTIALLFHSFSMFCQIPKRSLEEKEDICYKALEYFDPEYNFNFEKTGKSVLVKYDEDYFVFNKYSTVHPIERVRILCEISEIKPNVFKFKLTASSIYSGIFEVFCNDEGVLKIKYLRAVRKSRSLMNIK